MDKFMIDKYVEPKLTNEPYEQLKLSSKVQLPEKLQEPIETQHTYYEPEIIDNNIVLEPVEEQPSFRFITIIGLLLIVGYSIYYAVKIMYNKNNYLIKQNANTLDITLDELKVDVKNYIKEKYEDFLDWKDNLRTKSNKFLFKKHLDNGAFKATKYKAKNLLSRFT
jgi:uncharacterized protein YxeA